VKLKPEKNSGMNGIPVQCSIDWAIKPSGSWSLCEFVGSEGCKLFEGVFSKFRVGERMEQTFSWISCRNFGRTSRGWPKMLENWNNRRFFSIRTFLLVPSIFESRNRTDLQVFYLTNDLTSLQCGIGHNQLWLQRVVCAWPRERTACFVIRKWHSKSSWK